MHIIRRQYQTARRGLVPASYLGQCVCVCVCVCVFVSQCQMLLCSPLGRVDQTPFARRLLLAHTTSSVKPEVCSISQHNRWTAPRAYVINARKLIKNGRVVPELCSRTDGHTAGPHTNNHIYCNAVLPYLGSGRGGGNCFRNSIYACA